MVESTGLLFQEEEIGRGRRKEDRKRKIGNTSSCAWAESTAAATRSPSTMAISKQLNL